MFCSVHRDLDMWRRDRRVLAQLSVLKKWSSIKELHSRLRELGAPIYGTKDVLFRRLCEYEQIAARKKKEEEYLEMRRKELAVATEPVTPKILPGPIQPSEVERQHHMVNHLPPDCGLR